MKTVMYSGTLAYYDGPQIIEAVDVIGGHYVGVLLDTTEDGDKYLVVGVHPGDMRRFRAGELDLLDLIQKRPMPEWYIGSAGSNLEDPIALELQSGELSQTDFLPDAGYFLPPPPALAPEVVDVVGVLIQANIRSGTWRLDTETGGVAGKTSNAGPTLAGLSIGAKYNFRCVEKLTVTKRGHKRRTLILTHRTPALR